MGRFVQLTVTLACASSLAFAQVKPISQLVKKGEKYALLVDGKPFIMMGGQVLNNSAFPERMERIWPIMKAAMPSPPQSAKSFGHCDVP